MVEVDPMVIAAAGAAMIGLVAIATGACSKGSDKTPDSSIRENIAHSVASAGKIQPTASSVDEKAKKKKNKSKKVEEVTAAVPSVPSVPVVQPVAVKPPVVAASTAPAAPAKASVSVQEIADTSKKAKKNKSVNEPKVDVKVSVKEAVAAKKTVDDDDSVDGDAVPEVKEKVDTSVQRILAKKKEMAITFDTPPQNDFNQVDEWALVGGNKKPKKQAPVVAEKTVSKAISKAADESVQVQESAAVIDKVTIDTVIDSKKVGVVIGPKGVTKIALQTALNVEINLPKTAKESSEPVTVSVSGPAENVPKAIKAIQDLCTKGYSAVIEGEDFRETQVSVQPS